jgi:hypothetical protein
MCVSSLLPILFAGATGCVGPEPMWAYDAYAAPIGTFSSLSVQLEVVHDVLRMALRFDPKEHLVCSMLDAKAGATVAGAAMTIEGRGGHHTYSECFYPSFSLAPLPTAANPRLSVFDPSEVFACDLGTMLVQPPSPTLVPDGPWKFTANQLITLQWPEGAVPPSDVVTACPTALVGVEIVRTQGRQQQIRVPNCPGKVVLTFHWPLADLTCTRIQAQMSPRPYEMMVEIAAPPPAR